MTNSEEKLKEYLEELNNYFENPVEQESSQNPEKQEILDFYDFERTFEEQPDYVQNSNHNTQNDGFKIKSWKKLQEVFDYNGQRLLLLGQPGAGKTVLLRQFAKDKTNVASSLLTIFASIRTWNPEKEEGQEIINWLIEQGIKVKEYIDKDLLKQKLEDKDKQVLLLLDGLDELPEDVSERKNPNIESKNYRVKFIEKLNKFLSEYDENKIVVTCRSEDYKEIIENDKNQKLKLNGAVDLQLLNYHEIRKYLNGHLLPDYVSEITNVLSKNIALLNMVRTPFILNVLMLLYKYIPDDNKSKNEKLKKINNQDTLLNKFVEDFYNREKEIKAENNNVNNFPYSLEQLKNKLGQVSILMMSDKVPDDNEITRDTFSKVIPEENIDSFIKFSQNIYLLASTGNKQSFRFRHLLLRDYFAFSYINNFLNSASQTQDLEENIPKKEEIAKALGKLNRPEATDFLISLLEDSDKDVRYEAANSLGQLNAGFYFRGYQKDFGQDCLFHFELSIPEKKTEEIEDKPKQKPEKTESSHDSINQLITYVSKLKNQNEQLLTKLDQGHNQLANLQSQLSEAEKNIVTSQSKEIAELKTENAKLQDKLNEISNQLDQLQSQLSKTDKKIEDNYQEISQPIEKIYQEILELQKRISELPSQKKRDPKNKRDPWNI